MEREISAVRFGHLDSPKRIEFARRIQYVHELDEILISRKFLRLRDLFLRYQDLSPNQYKAFAMRSEYELETMLHYFTLQRPPLEDLWPQSESWLSERNFKPDALKSLREGVNPQGTINIQK